MSVDVIVDSTQITRSHSSMIIAYRKSRIFRVKMFSDGLAYMYANLKHAKIIYIILCTGSFVRKLFNTKNYHMDMKYSRFIVIHVHCTCMYNVISCGGIHVSP